MNGADWTAHGAGTGDSSTAGVPGGAVGRSEAPGGGMTPGDGMTPGGELGAVPMSRPVTDLARVMDVSGQHVVVTGGGGGIGFGISRAFAQRGANVAVLDVDVKGGTAAIESLRQFGGDHLFVECDVSDRKAVQSSVDVVHATFGHIDVLVNNAGISMVKPFLDMDEDLPEWHRTIAVDLHGTVNTTHAVGNKMRADKRGGLIINISSVAGARCSGSKGMPQVGYVAAKAAVNHLTVSWAIEFAEYDIRVNCIMPGPTHSRLDDNLTPDMRHKIAVSMLDRRFGDPLEIGALCVFMTSAEGSHLNGVVMPHDGGFNCIN